MILKYTKEALRDLIRLKAFIEDKNPEAAQGISSELVSGIENLTEFPQIGTKVEEAPDPEMMRDVYILDYRVRYLILEHAIYVLRIWHQKENR